MSNNSYKKFEDLDLLDSFLFIESTTKQENAKFIAKVIINRVLGWDVTDIFVETENGKSIRIYDIELNKYYQTNLPKRSRYYLSVTDSKFFDSSQNYSELPDYFSV